jgi:hypothetical protein
MRVAQAPMDKRCGKALVPALSPARRVGSPSAFLRQSVIKNKPAAGGKV